MFSRLRAPGLWVPGSVIDPNEWETFDDNLSNAIDGAGGGAYSLANDLTIGRADPFVAVHFTLDVFAEANLYVGDSAADLMLVEASSTFYSNFALQGPTTLAGPVAVTGLTNFENDVQFQTNVFFYDDVTFNEDLTISGTALLDVYGNSHFRGVTQVGSSGSDTLDVYASTNLRAGVTLSAPLGFNSGGYIKRRVTYGPDSNLVIGPKDTDEIIVQSGTITAPGHIYTIDDTGAEDDAMMIFTTEESAQEIIIAKPGGALLFRLSLTAGSGKYRWAEAHRIGGSWVLGRRQDP